MANRVDVAQLQPIALFEGLDPLLLEALAAQSQVLAYATDAMVYQEGEPLLPCLHVLVSGQLRISKVASTGKETILRLLPAGEVFAAPALFGDGKAPATIIATAPATVLTIHRQALLQSFAQSPELALHLLVVFNQRLQQLHNRVHGLVSERAIVRLVNYLEHVAAAQGTLATAQGEQLQTRLTHYQIARTIGITYEECVRLFRQLQPAIIYRRGGEITVVNWQHLGQRLGEKA